MLEVAQKYLQLKSGEYYKCFGKVDKVVGLTIESIGPKAKLNDLCMIFLDKERRDYVMSEVVGFKDSHIILMPFDNVEGVGVGCIVENTGHPLTVAVGDELLGHTVDGIGRVTDCDEKDLKLDSEYPIEAPPPDPMSRETSNTDYVAQMATFSQLEATLSMKESMASSNDQTTKSAALSLVGKEVIVTDKDSASGYYSGKVDYVTYKDGKIQLSINEKMYDYSSLYSVSTDEYYDAIVNSSTFSS